MWSMTDNMIPRAEIEYESRYGIYLYLGHYSYRSFGRVV